MKKSLNPRSLYQQHYRKDRKSAASAVNNQLVGQRAGAPSTKFSDNRPEVILQRKIQRAANQHGHAALPIQLKSTSHSFSRKAPLQRKSSSLPTGNKEPIQRSLMDWIYSFGEVFGIPVSALMLAIAGIGMYALYRALKSCGSKKEAKLLVENATKGITPEEDKSTTTDSDKETNTGEKDEREEMDLGSSGTLTEEEEVDLTDTTGSKSPLVDLDSSAGLSSEEYVDTSEKTEIPFKPPSSPPKTDKTPPPKSSGKNSNTTTKSKSHSSAPKKKGSGDWKQVPLKSKRSKSSKRAPSPPKKKNPYKQGLTTHAELIQHIRKGNVKATLQYYNGNHEAGWKIFIYDYYGEGKHLETYLHFHADSGRLLASCHFKVGRGKLDGQGTNYVGTEFDQLWDIFDGQVGTSDKLIKLNAK